jgi:hypothetical protein
VAQVGGTGLGVSIYIGSRAWLIVANGRWKNAA